MAASLIYFSGRSQKTHSVGGPCKQSADFKRSPAAVVRRRGGGNNRLTVNSSNYMHELKSISAAFVVAPAVTARGMLLESLLVVCVDGEQMAALVVGLVASASTA